MKSNIITALFFLVFTLSACSPYSANAPIGDRDTQLCERVREWVAEGWMPLEQAERFYGDCAPFEVPSND